MTRKFVSKKNVKTILLSTIVILVVLIILFPVIWMLPSVFMGSGEVFSYPAHWLPKEPTLDNFQKVFIPAVYDKWDFVKSLISTLIVAFSAVFLSLIFNMLTAYALARLEFRGKRFLWIFFILSLFVPGITIMLSSYKVVSTLGMLDTFYVLVLPGVLTSYNIFFFRQFFLSVPTQLEEAAKMDGMNPFQIFIHVFVPLSVTPMVVVGFSTFLGYWNSFLWPTLTITNNVFFIQIAQVIRILNDRFTHSFGAVITATFISMLIPIIVFGFAQNRIKEGITLTGIK